MKLYKVEVLLQLLRLWLGAVRQKTQYEPVLVIVYVLLLLTPIYPGSIAQYEERIRFCGNSDFAGSHRTPESEVIVHLVGSTKAYVYVSAIVGELAFSS